MAGNLASSLKRRNRGRPMDRYDRLPAALRTWLAGAALPWSAHSVLRLWARLMREAQGDLAAVLARMDLAERRMLQKDCPRIWGDSYPLDAMPVGPVARSGRSRPGARDGELPAASAPGYARSHARQPAAYLFSGAGAVDTGPTGHGPSP